MQPAIKRQLIKARFELHAELGEGGIGITYRAQDLQTQSWVAIKVVSLKQSRDWKTIDLLEREARILKSLNHKKIPKYIDSFVLETETEKIFYLVQELAPGKTLTQWVEQGRLFSEAEIFKIAQTLLETLSYLQSFTPPIIHRDIKPQNILLDEEGQVYLVDFGAVQDTYRHTVTGGSTVVGTFGYMAPEQFRGQASPATDLYGLGATLIFLLTGKDPAELPIKKMKIDFRAEVQIEKFLSQWLDQMLAPTLEARFDNAQTALEMLNGDRPMMAHAQANRDRLSINQTSQVLEIIVTPLGFRHWSMRLVLLGVGVYNLVLGGWFILLMMLPRANDYLPTAIPKSAAGLAIGLVVLMALLAIAKDTTWLRLTPQGFQFSKGLWAKPQRSIGNFQLVEDAICKGPFSHLQSLQISRVNVDKPCIQLKTRWRRHVLGEKLDIEQQKLVMEAIANFLSTSTDLPRQERERILDTNITSQL